MDDCVVNGEEELSTRRIDIPPQGSCEKVVAKLVDEAVTYHEENENENNDAKAMENQKTEETTASAEKSGGAVLETDTKCDVHSVVYSAGHAEKLWLYGSELPDEATKATFDITV